MNNRLFSRLGVSPFLMAALSWPTFTAAAEFAGDHEEGEKIILCYMIELQNLELAKEWHKIRQLPFNGMIFRTANYQQIMRPKEIPWSNWQKELDELKSVDFGHFKDTFLWCTFSNNHFGTTVDWFDDWAPVIRNLVNQAKVAKLSGMTGLIWDPENYGANPNFYYPGRSEHQQRTREEYQARARQLAEQIMTGIRKVYPDITILTLFGYPLGESGHYALWPSFLDGLLAASDPRFVLVDGYENSYYDKTKADFARGYARMRHPDEIAFRLCGEKARWARQGRTGFALFPTVARNAAWQWKTPLLDLNYFNPADFKRSLTHACLMSDRYVWLYTESGGAWLSPRSDWYPYHMHPVYLETIAQITGVPYHRSPAAAAAVDSDRVEPHRLAIPRLPDGQAPPAIDGRLTDAAWAGAVHVPAFVQARSMGSLALAGTTEAWVTYDLDQLYVAYRCHEPDMSALVISGSAERDSKVYNGDSVELWLTPNTDVRPFYQFIINANNFVFDRRGLNPEDFDGTWRSAVLKRRRDWQVELALPWKDLGIEMPAPGTVLRANLNRVRLGRPDQIRRWGAEGYGGLHSELSSWTPYERWFTEMTNLGYWVFE